MLSEYPLAGADIDDTPRKDDVVFVVDEHPIPQRPDGTVTADQVYGNTQRVTFDFPFRL